MNEQEALPLKVSNKEIDPLQITNMYFAPWIILSTPFLAVVIKRSCQAALNLLPAHAMRLSAQISFYLILMTAIKVSPT